MRNRLLLIIATLLIPSFAMAYDEDTHFYGTYAMARHAGIKHEVAMKIALSAQWMDESFISDPTSMLLMTITGVKKRRILHFPSSRINKKSTDAERAIFGLNDLGEYGEALEKKVAKITGIKEEDLNKLNLISVTQEDDQMASQMLFEGINEGNLMKAATGLHTMEDSFAHAGTPAGAGHAMWWHWPDRPYGSTEKYTRMVNTVMVALVGIRTMLPREALDCNLKTASPRNCEADPQILTESYLPLVMPVISHDVLRDPEYVKIAMKEFFDRSVESKYMLGTLDEFNKRVGNLKLVDGKTNAYAAVSMLFIEDLNNVADGKAPLFDIKAILADMGQVNSADSVNVLDVVNRYGVNGIKNWKEDARVRFAKVVAQQMLTWHVPLDMSDSHRMEFEEDKDEVRKFEVEMRVKNMQAFIKKNYGTEIQFVENNSKDDKGFYKEVTLDASAEPDFTKKEGFTPRAGVAYATFSLKEKAAFDKMILAYLFPTLSFEQAMGLIEGFKKLKVMIRDRSDYYAELKVIEDTKVNWITKRYKSWQVDKKYNRFRELSWKKVEFVDVLAREVGPMLSPLLKDLVTTHMHADDKVFVYRRDELFQAYIKEKNLKPFLGEKDTWKLEELFAPPAATPTLWNAMFSFNRS